MKKAGAGLAFLAVFALITIAGYQALVAPGHAPCASLARYADCYRPPVQPFSGVSQTHLTVQSDALLWPAMLAGSALLFLLVPTYIASRLRYFHWLSLHERRDFSLNVL